MPSTSPADAVIKASSGWNGPGVDREKSQDTPPPPPDIEDLKRPEGATDTEVNGGGTG
jgi:hypothetical protein